MPFDLRVVPLTSIVAHEDAEPRRVAKIAQRLTADARLGNPPLVTELDDQFVLLDGANRIGALRALGYRHAVVQVVHAGQLRLDTWHHALLNSTPQRLIDALVSAPGVRLEPATERPDGVCLVWLADGSGYLARPAPAVHPVTALSSLVHAYLQLAVVRRTTEPDLAVHRDAAGVVAFPKLGIDEVFGAVRAGARMPAGITRFLVDGRVLLLNVELEPLRSARPLDELNAWLADLVAARRAAGRVRHYPHPVYVLDD